MKEAFHQMIELRRSVRRFKPDPVDADVLAKLVDAARLCPSAANKQALVFIAVNDPSLARKIFEIQKFAAYLAGAGQPQPGEEPTAHILVAQDKTWDQIAGFVGHLDRSAAQRYIHFMSEDKPGTANSIPFES